MFKERMFHNPVMDFINTLCNLAALNAVFLITCLPVITIGPALAALYAVAMREARGEYGYLARPYLRKFRENLRPGIPAFLILAALGAFLLFGLVFWLSIGTPQAQAGAGRLAGALILWFLTVSYAFPLIARFENTTARTLKNALRLALGNKWPTLALLAADAFVLSLCLYLPFMKLFMAFAGFSCAAFGQAYIFNRVFQPYEKTEENGGAARPEINIQR